MVKRQLFAFIACLAGAAANELVQDIIIRSFVNANATVIADPALRADSVINKPAACRENNTALVGGEEFPCKNVDFLSFLAYKDMEIKERFHYFNRHAADIWGWLSPTGREFTLIAMDNGVAVIDSTNATNPCIIAKLPSALPSDIWADVKVYQNTLYHVKDQRGSHPVPNRNFSIEVFDLLPFDSINCHAEGFTPKLHFPNFINSEHGRSHNLAVNTESGRIYTVGANTCRGGLNVFDVKENRLQPKFLACVDGDNYTHDAQCVTYDGPDTRYTDKEICFAFNEDTLTIWDLTTPTAPVMLARTPYFNQAYSHQGWLNRGMTKVLLDDELDELCNDEQGKILYSASCTRLVSAGQSGVTRTSTTVFDVTNLTNPVVESRYIHTDRSIDHNLYVFGAIHEKGWGGNPPMENFPDPNYAYLNNYMAGLRILDIHDNNASNWFEAGYFDVTPNETFLEFFGAWSGYMHPSGVYAISSIERGLFLVQPKTAFSAEFPQTPAPVAAEEPAFSEGAVAGIMIAVLLVIFIAIFVLMVIQSKKIASTAAVGSPSGQVDSGAGVKHYTAEETKNETL